MTLQRAPNLVLLAIALSMALMSLSAGAQTRAETLRYVSGGSVNTLDPTMLGSTREAFAVSMSTYDRLVTFGKKQQAKNWVFDLNNIRGELAERFVISPNGLKITFYLRKDAKFHDGTPVTAEDVKWSLDRAVKSKSLASSQLLTGSMTNSEQFRIINASTFEVTLPKPDRLALANLATTYPIIINSKLAKSHATPDDPWAQNWLKANTAGSGAYSVESFKPGEQIILKRNEAWNRSATGKPAAFKRVITQTIPEAATRANLVERGDADVAIDLQANDAAALATKAKVKVVSTPMYNAVTYVSFNTQMAPFDNVKVRRAIAYAMPYDDMFKASLFGRGEPLFGAVWTNGPPTAGYPIKQPVSLDLAKAKQLLTDAGFPNGFNTTFSFNLGQAAVAEPMAALIKESLAKINIKVEINKLPDAQMSTQINAKTLPFFTENAGAWLPSTDYYYRNFYTGDHRWNYSSLNDPKLAELAEKARFELDPVKYSTYSKELNAMAFDLMAQVPIWQPNQDAVMAQSLEGFVYQFHRQIDFRDVFRK
jgi:peptide/nickel transport system substrate-binding protein